MGKDIELIKCKECGKEVFLPVSNIGRMPEYCSEICRQKHRTKGTTNYIKKRYKDDAEFRKHRIRQNAAGNKRRRENAKALAMDKLVDDLMAARTKDEVRRLLEKNVRLRSEVYLKHE